MANPGYQGITASQIPSVTLKDSAGTARIIAGELADAQGPARTFTPMNVWDMHLSSDRPFELNVPDGHTAMFVVLRGSVQVNGSEAIGSAEVGLFDRNGTTICIDHATDATVLMLSGQPIDEPIVGSGPFVMNSAQEIHQAINDYQRGRMGNLA